MRASHILVRTEKEAKDILAEASPANFASLAQQHSLCPSKSQGGDLGEFGPGMMVKPFEDGVRVTEIGAISPPVMTQFGWHLIYRTA